MPDPRHRLGLVAEEAVATWLASRGWWVLRRRWRGGGGEVDLLALDPDGVLVAVEVRARRSERAGTAATSLDAWRVARLRRSLAAAGSSGAEPHAGLRVDLVTAEPLPDAPGRWRLTRIPGVG